MEELLEQLFGLPEHASTFSWRIDAQYLTLIGLSALFTVPIVFLIVYFAIKYRRGSSAARERSHTNRAIEYTWIGGLLLLVVPVFVWSASLYITMQRPPPGALDIYVVGQQWMWKMQHPTGQREINELHVPLGRPVRLILTSQDVIHSLYVPAFRIKQDAIPGRYTEAWFEATKVGEYRLFCAEYCGLEHAAMMGRVIVMDASDYEAWLRGGGQAVGPAGTPGVIGAGDTPESMAEAGQQLFQQFGCVSCHRTDGNGPGPRLQGVFGSQVRLENGAIVVADEGYIRESIVDPNTKIVEGYTPIMPSYQSQLSEEQINQLVAYIRSLGEAEGAEGPTGPATEEGTAQPAETTAPGTPATPAVP